jgi:hypothetical protein
MMVEKAYRLMVQYKYTPVVLLAAWFVSSAGIAEGRLPGMLYFVDASDAMRPAVNETEDNEKEIDVGDYDGDGDLDVAIVAGFSDFGARRNKLYQNDSGLLTEVSATRVPGFAIADTSRNIFMRDYDGDGMLDIIVVNDRNSTGEAGRTKYYRNDNGDFIEEGLARIGESSGGAACGAVSVDVNGDGMPDLYVGNYPGPSQDTLFFNDGEGKFMERTAENLPSDNDYTVDVASADVNGDGKVDIIRSSWDVDIISYNDSGSGSTGPGDFAYSGSEQTLPIQGMLQEHAIEPFDADGDGDIDLYAVNHINASDRILINQGNDADDRVIWETLDADRLPEIVLNSQGTKASVFDMNRDGRVDVFRAGHFSRSVLLRNVSIDGDVRFVDWTPAMMIAKSGGSYPDTHHGWHAAIANLVGDSRADILFGAFDGERLYQQQNGPWMTDDEAKLAGEITVDGSPIAIIGGTDEDIAGDEFDFTGARNGDIASIILTAAGDFRLELLQGGAVVASSDRGGIHVEEVIETAVTGDFTVRITMLEVGGGDDDGDGVIDLDDFEAFQGCFSRQFGRYNYGCLTHDIDHDGDIDLQDFNEFMQLLSNAPTTGQYQLEVLVR